MTTKRCSHEKENFFLWPMEHYDELDELSSCYDDDVEFEILVDHTPGLKSKLKAQTNDVTLSSSISTSLGSLLGDDEIEVLSSEEKTVDEIRCSSAKHLLWREDVEENEHKVTRIGQLMRRQRALLRRARMRTDFAQTCDFVQRQILDAEAVVSYPDFDVLYLALRRLEFMADGTPAAWKPRLLQPWNLDFHEGIFDCELETCLARLAYLLTYCPTVAVPEELLLLSTVGDKQSLTVQFLASTVRKPSEYITKIPNHSYMSSLTELEDLLRLIMRANSDNIFLNDCVETALDRLSKMPPEKKMVLERP